MFVEPPQKKQPLPSLAETDAARSMPRMQTAPARGAPRGASNRARKSYLEQMRQEAHSDPEAD